MYSGLEYDSFMHQPELGTSTTAELGVHTSETRHLSGQKYTHVRETPSTHSFVPLLYIVYSQKVANAVAIGKAINSARTVHIFDLCTWVCLRAAASRCGYVAM